MSSAENKIDAETAAQDLARWAELMDIDLEKAIARERAKMAAALRDGADVSDVESMLEKAKELVLTHLQRGTAEVLDDGQISFVPQAKYKREEQQRTIVFGEPTGATFAAGKKGDGAGSRAMMSSMTGELPKRFESMVQRDLNVCEAITLLFLAARV